MRRLPRWMLLPAILLAACGKTGERPADAPGAATGGDTAAAAISGEGAIVTVIYNAPKDTAAFERYYRTTHVPLVVASQKEIGFTRADLTRFVSTLDGKKPPFYRQAELYFASMDDLKKGIATPAFKNVAGDLANFATGGLDGLVGVETR
jgi:uncharacterized protein (TIGR02118 family)